MREREEKKPKYFAPDMSDETEVFGVEKSLRNIPIRGELMYKPNIYTELGIYRSNKFGIRPTIYKSVKKVVGGDSGFEIQNIAKDEWLYRYVGSKLLVIGKKEQERFLRV